MDERTESYLVTALWASTISLPVSEEDLIDGQMDVDQSHPLHGIRDGEPFDQHYSIMDFTAESVEHVDSEVVEFFAQIEERGIEVEHGDSRVAHDFFLTRNGHGCGFWDGSYKEGDALTEIAESFGETDVWVDGEGQVHFDNCA